MNPGRKRYFTGLSRSTYLLAFASFFSDISTEMLYPVLPVFLTQTLQASGSIVGLVDGFAQALQNIVQGFSGALSDKLQRRKPIALSGYFLSAIAKPLMGLAGAWLRSLPRARWTGWARAPAPPPATPFWPRRRTRSTGARPSGSKASETTPAHS